ncbi:hypothetical protein F4778DRAFT_136748 [Xylariomycetidae sp. FL2044]|nr:hypothetical protein F4778DRAFT_136748 [Xylariomycetidae sp. FL2044]
MFSNGNGYTFVPFNSKLTAPEKGGEDMEKFKALRDRREHLHHEMNTHPELTPLVDSLLDQEIDEYDLRWEWDPFGFKDPNDPPLPPLKMHEKVKLIAEHRSKVEFFAPSPPLKPVPDPIPEGFIGLYLLRVTLLWTLVVREFMVSKEITLDSLMEELTLTNDPFGGKVWEVQDLEFDSKYTQEDFDRTRGRREVYYIQQTIDTAEQKEKRKEWSYRVIERLDLGKPKHIVQSEWFPMHTQEQYHQMWDKIKGTGRSLIFIKVSPHDDLNVVVDGGRC